jgi:hypothetical protein
MPLRYYTDEDYLELERAQTCKELLPIGLRVLERMRAAGYTRIVQVCGPISTGGLGSVAENIAAMDEMICELVERGFPVFNQMPFEGAMERVHRAWKRSGETGYCWPILNDFYLPIFESGYIKTLAFLRHWRDSTGACWEFAKAEDFKFNLILT